MSLELNSSVLVYGKMLAGKTKSCNRLADGYGMKPIDTDEELVIQENVDDIAQLIHEQTELLGSSGLAWEGFGWGENRCLQRVLNIPEPKIIGAGGRTIYAEQNRALIENTQGLIVIYLNITVEEQIRRAQWIIENAPEELVNRPALKGGLETFFGKMSDERDEIYANFGGENTIDASNSTEDINLEMQEILKRAA